MSGVAVVRYLMANDDDLTDVVDAANIRAGVIPLNTGLPAIGITEVDEYRRNTVSMNANKVLVFERVQVTVQAKTYPTQKSIFALVMYACRNRNGIVNDVDLDSILPDVRGPDFEDSDAALYFQSQDFIVKWRADA